MVVTWLPVLKGVVVVLLWDGGTRRGGKKHLNKRKMLVKYEKRIEKKTYITSRAPRLALSSPSPSPVLHLSLLLLLLPLQLQALAMMVELGFESYKSRAPFVLCLL
jgi:hypothetical protein